MTAAAAQAAAIRLAREQLEDALRKLAELAVTDATQSGLDSHRQTRIGTEPLSPAAISPRPCCRPLEPDPGLRGPAIR